MTVRQLAAALAALPPILQEIEVGCTEEADIIPVQHALLKRDDDHGPIVDLTGWLPDDDYPDRLF